MSLICWWPLNGDTKNYGTLGGEVEVAASSPVYTSGKIGQALYTGTLSLTAEQWKKIIGNTISIAMWIYTREDGSYSAGVPFFGMSGMSAPNNRKFSMFHYPVKTTLHCSWQHDDSDGTYWGCTYANFFPLNTWVHLCIVQDVATNTITVYRNGEQYSKSTVNGLSSMNFKEAGAAPIRANINYEHMNDLRIYDHALSQAEVKELSKALVMHYTFDDVLAEPTTNVSTISGWSSYTSYFVISERTETGLKLYRPSSSTNTVLALNNGAVTGKMTAGDIWTFSCYLYIDGKPYKCTQSDMSTYNYSGISYYSNDDGYYTCTFRVGSPETWIIHASMFGDVGTNVMCEIDKIQFEKKDHATPYTPSSRESMICNETGLNQPTSTKNIKLSTDTCSGIYSLDCSTSQVTAVLDLTGHSDATAAAWIKINDYGTNDCSCVLIGGIYLVVGKTGRLGAYAYGKTNPGYHYSPSNVTIPLNTWTHIANVWDGTTVKGYINGQLAYNASCSGSFSGGTANKFVGLENASGRPFNGKIAEVRLYTTPLSANDIAELYKTKAYVTNQGDIETHQFIEDRTQAQVTSKYNFECREIMESLDSSYQRLEYIASTGAQYIDTGYYWTSEAGAIIADLMITSNSSNQTVFGNEERYSGSTRYFAHILHGSGGSFSNYIGAGASGTNSVLTLNNRYVFEYITHGNNKFTTRRTSTSGDVTVYNNQVSYSGSIQTKAHTTSSTSNAGNIFIFSNHNGYNGTGPIQNIGGMRLYRFTMLDNNVMVRDFVPVKRLSDNVAGLFDLVEGKFYTTPTGSFTASSAINEGVQAKIHQDNSISGREIIEI